MKQPLTEAELRQLAPRLGGIRALVGPKQQKNLEHLSDEALPRHLAENPGHVRRPLIDTGKLLLAGFTAEVRDQLK